MLVGPSTRFADYQRWANNELYLPYTSPPPGRWSYAMGSMVGGLMALALQGLSMTQFSYERLADPKDSLHATSLWNRIWFVQLAGCFLRIRYTGIWAVSDAACALSGLGYNGVNPATKKTMWTRAKNIDFINVFFCNNWKELLDNWNCNTNIWLRENVYKRLAKPGKRPGFKSLMLTFMTSAFWHGISLGYYMTSVLAGLFQYIARLLRKSLRPVFFANTRTPNPTLWTLDQYSVAQVLYSIASIMATLLTSNFAVISFMTLDWSSTMRAYKAAGFYGLGILVLAIAAFQLGLGKALKPFHQVTTEEPKKEH